MACTSVAEGQVPWWCWLCAQGWGSVTSGAGLSSSIPFPTKAAQGAHWEQLGLELGPAHWSRWQVLVVAVTWGSAEPVTQR